MLTTVWDRVACSARQPNDIAPYRPIRTRMKILFWQQHPEAVARQLDDVAEDHLHVLVGCSAQKMSGAKSSQRPIRQAAQRTRTRT